MWMRKGEWLEGRKEGAALLSLPASPAMGGEVGGGGPSALTALSLSQEAPLLILKQNQQWICLENLHPNTPYELQVRVRPQQDSPATWSPWSQALAFKTRPAGTGGQQRWG